MKLGMSWLREMVSIWIKWWQTNAGENLPVKCDCFEQKCNFLSSVTCDGHSCIRCYDTESKCQWSVQKHKGFLKISCGSFIQRSDADIVVGIQSHYSLVFSIGYLRTKLWMGVLGNSTNEVLCWMQFENKRPKFFITQWFLLQNNAKTCTAEVVMSSLTDIIGKPV